MATTTNFGWETPDDTDLVKDGAAAMRTLGNAIDTSLVDLKGGTSGQVLSKASNTDMDFTWVAQDDSNAIQNAIVDAKGDLISATAADTPARLAVGANTAPLVADSTQSTGLRWDNDAWTSYTPVWTTSGTAPSLGNGSIAGVYKQRGKVVDFRMYMVAGSTTTFGTGNFFFSLPVNAALQSVGSLVSQGWAYDVSAGRYFYVTVDTGDSVSKMTIRTLNSSATDAYLNTVTATAPMTWASTDTIWIQGTYEAA
jgi:hypothetical protein